MEWFIGVIGVTLSVLFFVMWRAYEQLHKDWMRMADYVQRIVAALEAEPQHGKLTPQQKRDLVIAHAEGLRLMSRN